MPVLEFYNIGILNTQCHPFERYPVKLFLDWLGPGRLIVSSPRLCKQLTLGSLAASETQAAPRIHFRWGLMRWSITETESENRWFGQSHEFRFKSRSNTNTTRRSILGSDGMMTNWLTYCWLTDRQTLWHLDLLLEPKKDIFFNPCWLWPAYLKVKSILWVCPNQDWDSQTDIVTHWAPNWDNLSASFSSCGVLNDNPKYLQITVIFNRVCVCCTKQC